MLSLLRLARFECSSREITRDDCVLASPCLCKEHGYAKAKTGRFGSAAANNAGWEFRLGHDCVTNA